MFTTIGQIVKGLGLSGPDDVKAAQRAPNYHYSYGWDFGSVGAGASKAITVKIGAQSPFVGYMATGILDDGSGGAVSNRNSCQLSLSANDGVYQFLAYPWDCGVGTAVQPHYYLGVQPVFSPGAQVVATFTNNTAGTVRAYLRIAGAHVGK